MVTKPEDDYNGYLRAMARYVEDTPESPAEMSEDDADLIRELCDAFDADKLERRHHIEKKAAFIKRLQKNKTKLTLGSWVYNLSRLSRELYQRPDFPNSLGEANADDINDLTELFRSQLDMSYRTVIGYQEKARIFYRYHGELGVNPDHIATFDLDEIDTDEGKGVTKEDMLTREEIDRLTHAADHPRDKMVFLLLLYTGLRNTGARMLKIKNVNLEEGTYTLNSENGGLKKAEEREGERPLLFAKGAVAQWINNYHPQPDNPEAYLITSKVNHWKTNPEKPIASNTIGRILRQLKEETDIDKPLNPHALRHNFVTICKRDYNLDNDTIKYLIGHSEESTVMETTYSHLDGEDFSERTKEAFGLKEREEKSTLTPIKCSCGTEAPKGAKACYNCGMQFTPDARRTEETIADAIHEGTKEATSDEVIEGIDATREILKDPEAKAEIFNALKAELMDELRDELGK